jgi:hypothetical protein
MPSSLNGTGVTFNDGTTQSTAATAGNFILRSYTSPATWTKPANLKAITITLVAGGGGGGGSGAASTPVPNRRGGRGGSAKSNAVAWLPVSSIPGPVVVTIGAGGTGAPASNTPGNAGGTSSFGSFLSATGGGGGGTGTTTAPAGAEGGLATGPALVTVNYATADEAGWGQNGPSTRGPTASKDGLGRGSGGGGSETNAEPPSERPADPGGDGQGGIIIIEEFY